MPIVRKDKMLAGYNGNLESVIVHNSADETLEITNGLFVKLEGLMEGQREVEKAVLAGSADADGEVYFIHNSEVMYDERKSKLKDFRIPAGKVARAYHLFNGDIITLTVDLFDGAVAVGDKLVVKTAGKLGKDAVAVETAKIVFDVIEDSGHELDPEMQAFAVKVSRK